jgi:hypothetical protein
MSQITYRLLGPNADPIWTSYLSDVDAVGQAVLTRLRLFEGEWWSDLSDGTPLWQSILAVGGANAAAQQQQVSLLLQQRILGTPFVTGVSNVQVNFDPNARQFSFYAVVQTQFGPVIVQTGPQVPFS